MLKALSSFTSYYQSVAFCRLMLKMADETIGEGTFGKVLKGWYKPLDIAGAIKVGKQIF